MSGEYPFQRLLEGLNEEDALLDKIKEEDLNPSDDLPQLYNGESFGESHVELLKKCFALHFDKRPCAAETVEMLQNL